MKPVRIVAKDPDIDITVPFGSAPERPTGGLGGWQEVARQDDLPVSDWEGQPLLAQDLTLLLDEYPHGSVQREWNTIKKLGRDPNGEPVPPVFRIWGPVEYPGKAWVLPDNGIEILDGTFEPIKRPDGDWLRIEFVLHLMEYSPPDAIQLRGKKKRKRPATGGTEFPGNSYTTKEGDTLIKIAAAIYGDWQRWKEIGDKNGIHDPHRVLPAGRKLRL